MTTRVQYSADRDERLSGPGERVDQRPDLEDGGEDRDGQEEVAEYRQC